MSLAPTIPFQDRRGGPLPHNSPFVLPGAVRNSAIAGAAQKSTNLLLSPPTLTLHTHLASVAEFNASTTVALSVQLEFSSLPSRSLNYRQYARDRESLPKPMASVRRVLLLPWMLPHQSGFAALTTASKLPRHRAPLAIIIQPADHLLCLGSPPNRPMCKTPFT